MTEKITVKKYPNRRLYDTRKSTYIHLGDVANLIRGGEQIEVIDVNTNEDITSFILTQIILEEARNKNELLPVPLLHMIIQYGENILSEFFESYLEIAIKNFITYKSVFDEQFKNWLEMGMNLSDISQQGITQINPFDSIFNPFPFSEDEKK